METGKRWQIERDHHDKIYSQIQIGIEFRPEPFYRSRPYGMKRLLDRVGSVAGLNVADIGSGLGLFTMYFAHRGAKTVYSIDISEVALRSFNPPHNVIKLIGAAEFLPLRNCSIDVIWGAAVLHHLEIDKAVKEFWRVLRAGGRCFFYEPLGYNPLFNLYRRLTPSVRTPTEKPLALSDVQKFCEMGFKVNLDYYHFMAVIPQAVGKSLSLLRLPGKAIYRKLQFVESILAKLDKRLFENFPRLARYSQAIGVICTKLLQYEDFD